MKTRGRIFHFRAYDQAHSLTFPHEVSARVVLRHIRAVCYTAYLVCVT